MMDNRAIYRICSNLLDVYRPAYINLNRVIARVYSSVTSSFRFESAANNNKNMREMVANMVPFQAFNFLVTAYSPLISADRMCFSGVSVDELTGNMFEDSGLMVKCNLKYGKYMACSLMYMGDVVPRDINNTIR
jgi:tubulin alpha